MKKIINKPEDVVLEMCKGMVLAHPELNLIEKYIQDPEEYHYDLFKVLIRHVVHLVKIYKKITGTELKACDYSFQLEKDFFLDLLARFGFKAKISTGRIK